MGVRASELSSLVAFLRRGIVDRGDAEEMFAKLLTIFDATGALLADGWDAPTWHLTQGVPDAWIRDHAVLAHEDPSRAELESAPAGTWWVHDRDVTDAERELDLIRCFRASGQRDAAIVRLYSPFRDDLLFVLYTSGRALSAPDLQMLDLLYPHIAGACATRRALALVQGASQAPAPAIYVSFPGGAVETDAPARAILQRAIGPVSAVGWSRVERAIASAGRKFAYAQAGGRSQVLWPGLRIDFAVVRPQGRAKVRLAGFLVEERSEPRPAEADAPAIVHALLSPRELDVARRFAAGSDVPTIAELLRIGEETVRTHLRSAYRKLGVAGRAELAKALAREP